MRSFSPEDVQAYQAALDADFLRIERAFREVLRSEEAIREALAWNRRHGPHLPLTFVNIPLKDAPVIRAELAAVHRLLERHLNDPPRAKAYYQSAERAHTTLLRISGIAGVDEVFDEIRHEIDVAAFSYTLVGPHVTPDLIVVLELRASSASLMALLRRGAPAAISAMEYRSLKGLRPLSLPPAPERPAPGTRADDDS